MTKIASNLSGPSNLKSGYSTGTVCAAALSAALNFYLNNKKSKSVVVKLPLITHTSSHVMSEDDSFAKLNVKSYRNEEEFYIASVQKNDNDDLDVTKGVTVEAAISNQKQKTRNLAMKAHTITQTPFIVQSKSDVQSALLYLYAGEGVGIVTEEGLRVPVGYPAINPGPLSMIQNVWDDLSSQEDLYALISIPDGENISKLSANAKVGVVEGLSILGSRGIVKPLSSEAYAETLRLEIKVAANRKHKELILAIGNRSIECAKSSPIWKSELLIETGNFISVALTEISRYPFETLHLFAGPGKLAKIATGVENTHHHKSEIDIFDLIKNFEAKLKSCSDENRKSIVSIQNKILDKKILSVRSLREKLAAESLFLKSEFDQYLLLQSANRILNECSSFVTDVYVTLVEDVNESDESLSMHAGRT